MIVSHVRHYDQDYLHSLQWSLHGHDINDCHDIDGSYDSHDGHIVHDGHYGKAGHIGDDRSLFP